MKHRLRALSGRYLSALKQHLNQGARANLEPAHGLGRRAVCLGLETLDLARIHEGALATLEASTSKDGLIQRAGDFFAEAISPIEATHRAALKAGASLNRLNDLLRRRKAHLAASNRSLKKGIARRRTAEAALKESAEHYKTLVEESLALQKRLQLLTHRIMSAQEGKRTQLSHELQDEIAQTLLGINVRLLTVKTGAGRNAEYLQKEIANTQRSVDISAKAIKRFARELGQRHHEP
jgi:signal transduction histidine kinase